MLYPTKPSSMENKDLHKALSNLIDFVNFNIQYGVKAPAYTQEQIDSLTDKSFDGRIVKNITENKLYKAGLNSGKTAVTWSEIS